ncbi:hypothetical protein DRO97_05460 [Archaeoglobales archaeon]|nr:MAG: hypothetical protein DRO97_05460 [Archaeoglobales archaeon]
MDNKIFIQGVYFILIINIIIGSILVFVSCLAHSTLYSESNMHIFRVRELIAFFLAIAVLLIVEGALGLAIILFNLNPIYHNVVVFSIILLTLIVINITILRFALSISLRREGFEAFIYSIVICLIMYHIYPFIPPTVTRMVSIAGTLIAVSFAIWMIVYLIKYSRIVSSLVDPIDLRVSAKTFTFACALLGVSSIMLDFTESHGSILIPPAIVFAVSLIQFVKEMYTKYLRSI